MSEKYPLVVSIFTIVAIFADFALTANVYFKYGHSYIAFVETNLIVVGLTAYGILPFLMYALTIAILAVPLAFSNSVVFRTMPLYLLAIPHTFGALSWIIHQPYIFSILLLGFFVIWGVISISNISETDLNDKDLVLLLNKQNGFKMADKKGMAIGLLFVFFLGVFVGAMMWYGDSSKLDSITNTLDEMSRVELIGSQGSLEIRYPLLIHSEQGTKTTLTQSVFNMAYTRQDIRVHLELDNSKGSISPLSVVFEDWSANTPATETTIHKSNFIVQEGGFAYINVFLNGQKVGEIILISE